MKKNLLCALVAGFVVITAICLSSCKKDNGKENWIPTTYMVVTMDDYQNGVLRDGDPDPTIAECFYCTDPLYMCDHGLPHDTVCPMHSHLHYFMANDTCMPGSLSGIFNCPYQFHREHRHYVTYFRTGYHIDWHIGGLGVGE